MAKTTVLKLMAQIPDEAAAYEYLERLRWNGTPECPHCGSERCWYIRPLNGKSRATRTGAQSQRRVWKCGECRKQFSVLTDTVMHGTKIPLRTWVLVLFEMCANKNGIAAREIERKYGVTPRSAWHMTHRIREAMKDNGLTMFVGTVVADETWMGGKPSNRHGYKPGHKGVQGKTDKTPILSLVDRTTGAVHSTVVPDITGATLRKAIAEKVDMGQSVLHTDSGTQYLRLGQEFAEHHSVNHFAGEYVRGDVTTNHCEGFFSQLKRSIDGTHHHVSREHLQRYLAEFDFRYTSRKVNDGDRMHRLLGQVGGRRLAYKPLTSRGVLASSSGS